MRFDLAWIQSNLDTAVDADVLAEALTGCGFLVEVRDPVGDSEVWDVDVTTNRPDAMNHRGLAREAAVAVGAGLLPLELALEESAEESSAEAASVRIEDPEGCSRFVGRVVRGLRQAPSPEWLKRRLENIGIRPINNVVDITNYVLHQTGQPLHAYDLNLLAGHEIVVRRAAEGEELTTLDGQRRTLDADMLVIADRERAIGLAGVMGGANTEINDDTVDVLIEAASFDALTVRRMARALGMHTEASHRFERGCDPEMPPVAADLAATLLADLAGGTVATGRVDIRPRAWRARKMELSAERVSDFAGLAIEAAEIERIFSGLGFEPLRDGDRIRVRPPSFRVDIEVTADLYEEVIRHVGYGTVPARLPAAETPPGHRHPNWELVDRARGAAVACGLEEALTYAFIDPEEDALADQWPLNPGAPVLLENPLAQHQATLRRSLLPGLLNAAREALNQGERSVQVFEQGRAFAVKDDTGAHEHERLAILLIGACEGAHDVAAGFLGLKGVVTSVAESLGLPPVEWRRGGSPWLDEHQGAVLITREDRVAGCAGRLGAGQARRFGLKAHEVFVAELDLQLAPAEPPLPRFVPLPRFPEITADMTVEHSDDLSFGELEKNTRALAGDLVESVALQARFAGEPLPEGIVRTTLRLVYRHPERSLTQDEVNHAQQTLREGLGRTLGVRFA